MKKSQYKSQVAKSEKTDKSKKWIQAKKAKAFRTKNLGQSKLFFIFGVRKAFTKLKQIFVKALILDYFDPEHHI